MIPVFFFPVLFCHGPNKLSRRVTEQFLGLRKTEDGTVRVTESTYESDQGVYLRVTTVFILDSTW